MRVVKKQKMIDEIMSAIREGERGGDEVEKVVLTSGEWTKLCRQIQTLSESGVRPLPNPATFICDSATIAFDPSRSRYVINGYPVEREP